MARTADTITLARNIPMKRPRPEPMETPGPSHIYGPWSHFSGDVFRTVMARLNLEERIRASAVCKNWHTEYKRMTVETPEEMVAWNFNYRWEKSDRSEETALCTRLYSFQARRLYMLEWTSYTKVLYGAKTCAQIHSWFLFAKKWQFKTLFFLYNAYSNRQISLPNLHSYYDVAAFSDDPLSTGCTVFASYHTTSKVYVATCRVGDSEWRRIVVDAIHPLTSVVYDRERNAFFSLFSEGVLGRFGVGDQEWSVIGKNDYFFQDAQGKEIRQHLIQYDGKLLLIARCMVHTHILKFEWPEMKWVDVSTTARDIFSKSSGDGRFFNLNEDHYARKHQRICWIDPPSVTNYHCNISEQARLMDQLSTAVNYF